MGNTTEELLKGWYRDGKPWFDEKTVKLLVHFVEVENEQYLESKLKNHGVIGDVIDYYWLKDGDMVQNGDEYYDADEEKWVTVEDLFFPYEFNSDRFYKTRRVV